MSLPGFIPQRGVTRQQIQSMAPGKGSKPLDGNLQRARHGSTLPAKSLKTSTRRTATQSRYFSSMSVLCRDDGTPWFGGENGITVVETANVQYLRMPRIQITEIKVNDKVAPGLADAITHSTNISTIRNLVQNTVITRSPSASSP